MKKYLLFLGLFIASSNCISAKTELDSLFKELDNTIRDNLKYIDLKENRIEGLKTEKNKPDISIDRIYDLNMALYDEYRTYVSDSAISYLNKNMDIAYSLNNQYKINEISVITARFFSSLGMYKEAIDVLNNVEKKYIDDQQQIDYYLACRYIYSGLGMYSRNTRDKGKYWRQANAYRDSLFSMLSPLSEDYLRIEESMLREKGKISEALYVNDKRLALTRNGSPEYALATFYRSLLYRKNGDVEMQKKYLILSALSDIQSAIRDNASIPVLANILMSEGDIDRAYLYVRFSLDNINDYNTRLRSAEILGIQTIIDKAYQTKNEEQKKELRFFLILTSVLSLLLIVSVCYVYTQMKKGISISKHLKVANLELDNLNQKLNAVNSELKSVNQKVIEANYIKEEYIGYFLDQCSAYIGKLDGYRKMVNKKIQDKHIESLYKITKESNLQEDELKELLSNFDLMFTRLFPDFIDKFNSLLLSEEQVVLKKGEILNTELRIYALIRLGIDDSSQIANFLGYSVNTIYNYRAKMKNRAKIQREDFEWTVRRIGTFKK